MLHLRRLLQAFGGVTTQGRLCTRSADTMSQVKVISYEDLKKVTGKVPVFDVRSPEEVSNGKIPSAVNIPGSVVPFSPDEAHIEGAETRQHFLDLCEVGCKVYLTLQSYVTHCKEPSEEIDRVSAIVRIGIHNHRIDEIEQALKMDPETFKKKYAVNKPKPEDNIIVHCQMGRRGARAAEIAMAQGYAKVQNYAGGYKEWSDKGGK